MLEDLDLIKVYEDASKSFYNNTENRGQKSRHWLRYDSVSYTHLTLPTT